MQTMSTDEQVIAAGIAKAEANETEIDDLTAKVIASQWHGGQTSALYALASSGAITHSDVWGEVSTDYKSASSFDRKALDFLGTYLLHAGVRGPVAGWENLNSSELPKIRMDSEYEDEQGAIWHH